MAMYEHTTTHGKDWYFSEEGRLAYEQANTIPKRIEFFYDYLSSIYSKYSHPGWLRYRLACILAAGIAESSLSYAQYPDILNQKTNPFIDLYIQESFGYLERNARHLLGCLHEKSDYPNKKSSPLSGRPWAALQMPEDQDLADIYTIERLIIWLFGEFAVKDDLLQEKVLPYYPYQISSY